MSQLRQIRNIEASQNNGIASVEQMKHSHLQVLIFKHDGGKGCACYAALGLQINPVS